MKNIAIIGAGNIAEYMAKTIRLMDGVKAYAVASRSLEKAEEFAKNQGFEKAYGNYEELVKDDNIDLVYIATPHSHHYEHIKLCLENNKPVLCEKAFTANAKQAREVCELAQSKGLLLAEAIWPRYMPIRKMIDDILASGVLGEQCMLTANIAYDIQDVPRVFLPELAGGALLDITIYPLNFASMCFGDDIASFDTSVQMFETGVDKQENITLHYTDGKMACLTASTMSIGDLSGTIMGSKGYLNVDNVNYPKRLKLYIKKTDKTEYFDAPPQLTGFEFELQAALDAIDAGAYECPQMPHSQIIKMMDLMDSIRHSWGMVYPFE